MSISFSFFGSSIKKIKRSRLRRIIRGYRLLKQSGQIDLISSVKQALTEQHFGLTDKNFYRFLMGAGCSYGEIVVRQYLLIRLGGLSLNQALLYASGKIGAKVIYPLPKLWRVTINQHGFKVANFRSSLLWQLYIVGALLYGVLQIAQITFSGITSRSGKDFKHKRYVYFANLSGGNLPQGDKEEKSYDIVSWYLNWSGRSQDIEAIHHSVPNVANKTFGRAELFFQTQIIPSLKGSTAIIKFIAWGIGACFIAFIECLRGNWWHAFLLNQTALSAQLRSLPKSRLACEYLFHNSGFIYRPLWTYDAEKVGSKITFYFYSTNCESFKTSETEASIMYGWKAMSWPNYLVWDNRHADFVRMSVGNNCEITIVGSIWFQDSNKKAPVCKGRKVAVFDVTPFRSSFYCTLGIPEEFYTPDIVNKFLEDIVLLAERNYSILWKRKRNIGALAHPLYKSLVHRLDMLKGVVLIDPEISAVKVIEQSDFVISIPFTSTALIAHSLGKASAYYDPTGKIVKTDVAGHGIPLLSNYNELFHWVSEVCDEKKIN
jgi:polysaccharide biosynthesis PFTS motif protein